MTAVVLSGASSAPVLPTLPRVSEGVIQSLLKGVVFYGLLVGGLAIPFAGALLQAFFVN